MKKAYMLIGVPAAGKSTWVETFEGTDRLCHILSSDNIIEDIASRYGMTYSEAFPDLIGFADKYYWNTLETIAFRGENVILDRTHLNIKSRKRALTTLKSHGYEVTAVVFSIPEADEWKRRLASRPGKNIPEHVLQDMVRKFEFPQTNEGFDHILV